MKIIKDSIRSMDQCAHGHTGAFKMDSRGAVLKTAIDTEVEAYLEIQKDPLKEFCPEFFGEVGVEDGDERYLVLGNVTRGFDKPIVLDCKIGGRTFLESECSNSKPRKDLYEKMVKLNPDLPTPEENASGEITKLRYMLAREELSATSILSFRIDGIVGATTTCGIPLQRVKYEADIRKVFENVLEDVSRGDTEIKQQLVVQILRRLKALDAALRSSAFFASHEMIGASLLFVLDHTHASFWLIDLAKCQPLPPGVATTHATPWVRGNHEDGFLTGLENMTVVWSSLLDE